MTPSSALDIDRFRLAFFQRVIDAEQQSQARIQRQQRICYHRYQLLSVLQMGQTGQTEWICSRCDHVIQRRIPV